MATTTITKWQCNQCGIIDEFEIELDIDGVQECKCGGWASKVSA